jgi:hypothetical protein
MVGLNTFAYLPPSVQGYYDKRALIRSKQIISAYDLAQKKTLPEGEGSTVIFWRYVPLSKQTTALTETVDGGITLATRQQLVYNEVPVIPVIQGDFISVGILANLRSIDQGTAEKVDVVSQQAAETIDYILNKEFACGLQRMRADADATYSAAGTTDAAGSTTSIVDSTRTAAKAGIGNDFYAGGFLTITSGVALGQTRQISAYTNSSGTFTTAAFDVAPGTGVTYTVAVGTGIGSTSNINSKALRRANRLLKVNKAMRYDDNYFRAVLDPDVHYDFFDDPDFVKAAIYKDRTDNLETLVVGTFAGVKCQEASQLYRETVAGVESDGAGAVHIVPVLGKEAVGCVSLGATPGGKKNFQIFIRTWEQLGQPMPLYDTIGWQGRFKAKTLNGCFGVGLMCGASDQI